MCLRNRMIYQSHTGKNAGSLSNILTFKNYPQLLLVETVYKTVFRLNCFPYKNGIHLTLSPLSIVTGSHLENIKHCKLQFCTYAKVLEQHSNSLFPRTEGAIALCLTGNAQGSYYFQPNTQRNISSEITGWCYLVLLK